MILRAISFRTWLNWFFLVATAALIAYICGFKILDLDFWWHVKAGEIMVQTHHLIDVEPFAYTREGLAYLPRYEYLAQVALYYIWDNAGVVGIMLWRMSMAALAISILLLIAPRNIWPNAFIAILLANINRPAFMDRPQLFSFVFFCTWLWLCFRYLTLSSTKSQADQRSFLQRKKDKTLRRLLIAFVVLQVIWANFHGGTNVVAVGVFGALVLERAWQWWRSGRPKEGKPELKSLALTVVGLGLAVMATPNGVGNYAYVLSLLHEQSNTLIKEWQPRPFPEYVRELGPFWVLAVGALALGRRHLVFSSIVLAAMGYLSLQSYRHGIFLLFAAFAVAVYQLRFVPRYQNWLNWLTDRPAGLAGTGRRWLAAGGSVLLLVAIIAHVHIGYTKELLNNNLYGFGVAQHGQGAYDFLERESITGRMFNTYNLGGYFIYRGHPNRKVFIDGRNVDYGTEFVNEAIYARAEPEVWQKLNDSYHFDYAVLDYRNVGSAELAASAHLDKNKDWALVYLDDWASVYLKRTPANEAIIERLEYELVTPAKIGAGTQFTAEGKPEPEIEAELLRVTQASPVSIKARLLLAMQYVQTDRVAEGRALAEEAHQVAPYRTEPFEIIGISYMREAEWAQAALTLEEALKRRGRGSPEVNYDLLAEVFSKAGDSETAEQYHQKFLRSPLAKQGQVPEATP